MKNMSVHTGDFRKKLITIIVIIAGCGFFNTVTAQELPPRPIVVTANSSQPLAFGAFSPGASGGNITVYTDGSRSSSGSIVLLTLGYSYSPAMFYVKANPGTVLSFLSVPPATLSGSGGGTITLDITETLPTSPFVTTLPWPQQTTVLVGGMLTLGNIVTNPPGTYTGSFTITIIRE